LIRPDAPALGVEIEPSLLVGFDNFQQLFARDFCALG